MLDGLWSSCCRFYSNKFSSPSDSSMTIKDSRKEDFSLHAPCSWLDCYSTAITLESATVGSMHALFCSVPAQMTVREIWVEMVLLSYFRNESHCGKMHESVKDWAWSLHHVDCVVGVHWQVSEVSWNGFQWRVRNVGAQVGPVVSTDQKTSDEPDQYEHS